MSDKKIDGSTANHLMDAVEHLAKLELEMRQLKWRLCYHEDNSHYLVSTAMSARTHARKTMEALARVEYRLQAELIEATEQGRAIRAVK